MTLTGTQPPPDGRHDTRAIETLTFRLILLLNLITKPFNASHGAQHGISLSEWRCIMWLAAHPGSSGQATANGIGLDRMSVSRNLRLLETKGSVSRKTDKKDRKRWQWCLTEPGWVIYDAIIPEAISRDQTFTDALSEGECAVVNRFLKEAARSVSLSDDGPPGL
ncbi:MAG: MarR family winged helix-turn-helix transcriptional regulator [Rhodobacteraceae bacterium]|nr:MarR family winged helix-turn-helix transcriptional regulator [Paracoccaceae bacterium]